jgi:hypothetical protein
MRRGGRGATYDRRIRRRTPRAHPTTVQLQELSMLLTVAIVLFVLWAVGFLAFQIASGIIHLALFVAVVALIAHFVRRRAPRAV